METVFHLDELPRAEFLQLLMRSTGCTYICLWSYSYLNQENCLIGWDGCYSEEDTQSIALGLFIQYQQLIFTLENDFGLVPGFAFRNNRPYIELGESELQNQASHPTQRLFYQEAGIKRAVFVGCRSGEIELGLSNVVQLNMEMEMEMEVRSFFPEDFSRQLSPVVDHLSQPTDPNGQPSSSSSLRSLLTSSLDSSLVFTIPSSQQQAPTETTPSSLPAISSSINNPFQQAMQALSQIRINSQLPTLESENATIIKAILDVLISSSSSASSTSYHSEQSQNLPYNYQRNPSVTAFKRYASVVGDPTTPVRASLRAQSIMKRAISFYKKFISVRREKLLRNRHHMLSERRRRQKLNECFGALRSLLPSGTKKDKASVLTSSREYLNSLKAQIEELSRQNQLLEAQLLLCREAAAEVSGSSDERLNVGIIPVSESTSEQRIIDLRVSVRGERPIEDILIHLLEFFKLDRNVSLMSIEANTQIAELGSVNYANLRLRIEGNEWDESSFQEAVKRLVADLAQ